MKVALVLTGLLRGYEKAYPSFKRYFLDRYEVDVFLSIWSERGWYTGKGYLQSPTDTYVSVAPNDKGFHTSGERVDANAIMALYNPKVLHIEDFALHEAARIITHSGRSLRPIRELPNNAHMEHSPVGPYQEPE